MNSCQICEKPTQNPKYCCHKCFGLARSKFQNGSNNANWRGGRMMVDGYFYKYSPNHPHKTQDKYVAEHRLVMEESIGRILEPPEVVHHINGIRTDNRRENLILLQNQSIHVTCHGLKNRDDFAWI